VQCAIATAYYTVAASRTTNRIAVPVDSPPQLIYELGLKKDRGRLENTTTTSPSTGRVQRRGPEAVRVQRGFAPGRYALHHAESGQQRTDMTYGWPTTTASRPELVTYDAHSVR